MVDGDTMFTVELRRTGVVLPVPPGRSILEVVRSRVPDVQFSCTRGECGACVTTVLEGVPDHRDTVLSARAKAANRRMMICVSRAAGNTLVLDI